MDGIQFNSYNDSDLFIEKIYRNSNVSVLKMFLEKWIIWKVVDVYIVIGV